MKLRALALDSLGRDTAAGTLVRVGLFLLVMMVLFGASLGVRSIVAVEVAPQVLGVMFLIAVVPQGVGLVMAEIPRGADWLMFRLGIATFCRTGLPLLFVIVVSLNSESGIADQAIGFLSVFYMCGFLASVWISLNRFAATVVPPVDLRNVRLQEVKRAAV